jgi:hypothetical protein
MAPARTLSHGGEEYRALAGGVRRKELGHIIVKKRQSTRAETLCVGCEVTACRRGCPLPAAERDSRDCRNAPESAAGRREKNTTTLASPGNSCSRPRLRWNCVTATDPNLLQAPFRAGIKIDAYQMESLRKVLRLPRVNLFIADDTGLGKTIEAGLIARELLLRKKAKTIVVATPPSVLEHEANTLLELGLPLFVSLRRNLPSSSVW